MRTVVISKSIVLSCTYRVERWSGPDEIQDDFMSTPLQLGRDVSIHLKSARRSVLQANKQVNTDMNDMNTEMVTFMYNKDQNHILRRSWLSKLHIEVQ